MQEDAWGWPYRDCLEGVYSEETRSCQRGKAPVLEGIHREGQGCHWSISLSGNNKLPVRVGGWCEPLALL